MFESAWELDYLDLCIFHSAMIRARFPPPAHKLIPAEKRFAPQPPQPDIRIECPSPDTNGAWDALAWKTWLGTVSEGHVIVPAVPWQAWWTLLAVLNGADRSGRWYDFQVKAPDDSFDELNPASVYI